MYVDKEFCIFRPEVYWSYRVFLYLSLTILT
jgi:hypothetical protein